MPQRGIRRQTCGALPDFWNVRYQTGEAAIRSEATSSALLCKYVSLRARQLLARWKAMRNRSLARARQSHRASILAP